MHPRVRFEVDNKRSILQVPRGVTVGQLKQLCIGGIEGCSIDELKLVAFKATSKATSKKRAKTYSCQEWDNDVIISQRWPATGFPTLFMRFRIYSVPLRTTSGLQLPNLEVSFIHDDTMEQWLHLAYKGATGKDVKECWLQFEGSDQRIDVHKPIYHRWLDQKKPNFILYVLC